MTHSPFHVVEEFLSPLHCEQILASMALRSPDLSMDGDPLKHERIVPPEIAASIMNKLQGIGADIEQRYDAKITDRGLVFQQYWENPKMPAEALGCENSQFLRKKWVKTKDVDLVGFIWLKDYHDSVPLDPRCEVFGGKLEFPAYNFSLIPACGTLVLYPASPHFVTAISHVLLGSLEQIKVSLTLRQNGEHWEYKAVKFPGSYQQWLIPND
jgi:hypothetical protein